MASKFIIFAVFAVLAQSSLAKNLLSSLAKDQNDLAKDLGAIKIAQDQIVDGLSNTVNSLFVFLGSTTLGSDFGYQESGEKPAFESQAALEVNPISEFKRAYESFINGLSVISNDEAAFSAAEPEAHAGIEYMVNLYQDTVKTMDPNDPTSAAMIEERKQLAMSRAHELWTGCFDLIRTVSGAHQLAIDIVANVATKLALLLARMGYDALEIIRAHLAGESNTQITDVIAASIARKDAAIAAVVNEARIKMNLLQAICVAKYTGNDELVNQMAATAEYEDSVRDEFMQSSADYWSVAIASLEGSHGVSSESESLSETILNALHAVWAKTIAAISQIERSGSAHVSTDLSVVEEQMSVMAEGLEGAIVVAQGTDATEAETGLQSLKKKVMDAAVIIWSAALEKLVSAVSNIDDKQEVIEFVKYALEVVKQAIERIFAGTSALLHEGTYGSESSYGTKVSTMDTAHIVALLDFNKEVSGKFDIIARIGMKIAIEKSGFTVPEWALRT